jgi:hypothetical protein
LLAILPARKIRIVYEGKTALANLTQIVEVLKSKKLSFDGCAPRAAKTGQSVAEEGRREKVAGCGHDKFRYRLGYALGLGSER